MIFVLFTNTLGETKKRSQQLQNLILQYTLYPAKPDKKQGPNSKMHIDNRKCMNKVYMYVEGILFNYYLTIDALNSM